MNTVGIGRILGALALALGVGACVAERDYPQPPPRSRLDCRRFTSCGTCTPVLGCGWCSDGSGSGTCESSPRECPTAPPGWTWDPSGCGAGADAGAEAAPEQPADAGDAPEGSACRWPPNAVTTSAGGSAGCLPSAGGGVCASPSDYTLVCYGGGADSIPAPVASLACQAASASPPANVALYCCPCAR